MTDDIPPREPDVGSRGVAGRRFLTPEIPPEHRANFWQDLDDAMAEDGVAAPSAPNPPDPVPLATQTRSSGFARAEGTRSLGARRAWSVLAVAATALVLAGVAVVALRGGGDPPTSVTTDLAVDAPNDAAPALDGSDEGAAGETAVAEREPEATTNPTPVEVGSEGEPVALPEAPNVLRALGAEAETIYLAQDGDLPADARFLATWESQRLSWYSVVDSSKSCSDAAFADIRYVNASGITQLVHDPQIRFSGDISHFVVDPAEKRAAWLVSCGTQLEFYVGALATNGEFEDRTLVWFGEGDPTGALIVWESQTASLNFVDADGEPVYVDYDTRTALASGTGTNPAPTEPGSPPGRGSIPFTASGDALFSYWSAPARSFADTASDAAACDTEALWVRQPGPRWTVALAGEFELRTVDVVALSDDATRIAFADSSCDGRDGRLFVGQPGADGLIRDVRSIDLSAYVPGFAYRLFWVDASTLRIETDNSALGVRPVTFDYRLGDDTEPGILVQLD